MAGVGFATAYRELKVMGRYQLVASSREHGREVYAANADHPDADILRRLANSKPDRQPPKDENAQELRRRLRSLGAPLAVEPAGGDVAAVEEVLVEGVKLARRDPALTRAMPVCFWTQRDHLDPDHLVAAARRAGEKQAVGFLLELTGLLAHDKRLSGWARGFKDHRIRAANDFFQLPPTENSRELAETRTPPVARKWGFRMNMDMDAFRSLFDKFAHVTAQRPPTIRRR